MKGNFYAPQNLLQLEETLKEKEPYSVLVVSTTGLDNANFSEHSPIRVSLSQFEFNNETRQYDKSIEFDNLVQAPQVAIDKAIENEASYDIFKNSAIDKEAYLRGDNVLSQEAFKKEFDRIISVIKEDKGILILNGGMEHCEKFLDKIGCADGLRELDKANRTISQTDLTSEYLKVQGVSGKATLENLRNQMLSSPTGSFLKDEEKMKEFKKLSKEDFLKAFPKVTENEYNLTQKDIENREAKIIGADKRIDVINDFITKHGRNEKILEPLWQTKQREADVAYFNELSEKGKERYENADLDEKFETLINKNKVLNLEKIMSGENEYSKLMKELTNENNKGMIFLHTATTGFENGDYPQKTGFPIKVTAFVFPLENGELNQEKILGFTREIQAPNKSVAKAEQKAKTGYDAFKDAGIDIEKYKAGLDSNGKDLLTPDEFATFASKFFSKYPPEQYPIVTFGGITVNGKTIEGKSFAQASLQNIANLPICDVPSIDMAQVVKEYSFLMHQEGKENALFKDGVPERFSMQAIAKANGHEDITGTHKKTALLFGMVNAINNQYLEKDITLEKPIEKETSSIKKEEIAEEIDIAKAEKEITDKVFLENADVIIEKMPKNFEKASEEKVERPVEKRERPRVYSPKEKPTNETVKPTQKAEPITSKKPITSPSEEKVEKQAPSSTAQSGIEGLDVSRLVEIITIQSEMISKQSEIVAYQSSVIAENNLKLFDVLKEQNNLMKSIVLDKEPSKDEPKKSNVIDYVAYVEEIKSKIHDLSDKIKNNKVENHLLQANKSLTEGQSEIEQIHSKDNKDNRNLA